MKQEKATTTEWDAASYEELADPMTRWGANFLEFVRLEGDEAVVDAGCGTGRVTELLLGRLPEGTLLAVDVSEKMVEVAAGAVSPVTGGWWWNGRIFWIWMPKNRRT